jgi:hypothetical protein
MKVYIVEGTHPSTPGQPLLVCADQVAADNEALDLVNIIRKGELYRSRTETEDEPYTLDPLPAGADWQEGLREWQRADVIGHGADPDEVAAMDDDELARESECDVWISEHDVIGLAAAAKGKRS